MRPDYGSHEEPHCSHRRRGSSSSRSLRANPASNARYSVSNTECDKSPDRQSNHSDHSIDTRRHKSWHSLKQAVTIIKQVNVYYQTVTDWCKCRMSEKSQNYDDDAASKIVKIPRRLEVQLKSRMFDASDRISILDFLPVFQIACNTNATHEREAMWIFHFS